MMEDAGNVPADQTTAAGGDVSETAIQKLDAEDQEISVDEALAESGGEDAGFGRGDALSGVQAGEIAAARRATVIVLAGGPDSGKTTLLASIYERFGRGPLAGHWFLGSRTLHGFEKRCYRSIHGDGPGDASGGHTSSEAPPWLHIRTARIGRPSVTYELLLGDFSGEHFDAIANGTRAPSAFPALRRADHLCLTLDGAKLADPTERLAEKDLLVELLRALLGDSEGIADVAAISFILTKADLVLAGGDAARDAAEDVFGALQDMLGNSPGARRIGYLQTAARSTVEKLKVGHGMEDLLARWTDSPALHIRHRAARMGTTSEFDDFKAP